MNSADFLQPLLVELEQFDIGEFAIKNIPNHRQFPFIHEIYQQILDHNLNSITKEQNNLLSIPQLIDLWQQTQFAPQKKETILLQHLLYLFHKKKLFVCREIKYQNNEFVYKTLVIINLNQIPHQIINSLSRILESNLKALQLAQADENYGENEQKIFSRISLDANQPFHIPQACSSLNHRFKSFYIQPNNLLLAENEAQTFQEQKMLFYLDKCNTHIYHVNLLPLLRFALQSKTILKFTSADFREQLQAHKKQPNKTTFLLKIIPNHDIIFLNHPKYINQRYQNLKKLFHKQLEQEPEQQQDTKTNTKWNYWTTLNNLANTFSENIVQKLIPYLHDFFVLNTFVHKNKSIAHPKSKAQDQIENLPAKPLTKKNTLDNEKIKNENPKKAKLKTVLLIEFLKTYHQVYYLRDTRILLDNKANILQKSFSETLICLVPFVTQADVLTELHNNPDRYQVYMLYNEKNIILNAMQTAIRNINEQENYREFYILEYLFFDSGKTLNIPPKYNVFMKKAATKFFATHLDFSKRFREKASRKKLSRDAYYRIIEKSVFNFKDEYPLT